MDLYPLSIAFKFISWNFGFKLFFIASMTDSFDNGKLSSAVTAPNKTMFKAKTLPASIASCVPSIGSTCLKFSFNVLVIASTLGYALSLEEGTIGWVLKTILVSLKVTCLHLHLE